MLAIFRRHLETCTEAFNTINPATGKLQPRPRNYRRCDCPMHAEGHLAGKMIRKSCQTTSWTVAQKKVRDAEARGAWEDPADLDAVEASKLKITDCVMTFLRPITAESGGKARSTRRQMQSAFIGVDPVYAAKATSRVLNDGLLDWCKDQGYTTLDQLTLPVLSNYIGGLKMGPLGVSKRIQVLRRFFRYAANCEWVRHNIAMGLEHPQARSMKGKSKTPFDREALPKEGPEMTAILEAAGRMYGDRAVAIIQVMRRAGLRISDAATFNRTSLYEGDCINLGAMHKTSEPVFLPMHPDLKAALEKITPNEAGYYFWSGDSAITTATDNWRVRLTKIFKAAGITGGHPHRFRHTFAVDLLLRGVAIDQVKDLLGHHSVKITEKHYLSFVKARRDQITDSVRRAWGSAA